MASVEDIQQLRRDTLKSYIEANKLSVNAFAIKLDRQASFFSDLFRGKKAFRENLAEMLEEEVVKVGLPPIALRKPPGAHAKVVTLVRPWPFSFSREQYDRLPALQRADMNGRIAILVEINEAAIGVAEKRARSRKKSAD